MSQQTLRLDRPSNARFDSFWPGPNAAVIAALQDFCLNDEDGQQLLVGPTASGKSHLAQACCRARWDAERKATYLQVQAAPLDENSLADFVGRGLLVVDGLCSLRREDEIHLLRLIDLSRAAAGKLLFCSRVWPEHLKLQTPDLRSRLQWGATWELKIMSEPALQQMLDQRAALLGVKLQPRVVEFLMRRLPRDPAALIHALEQAYAMAVQTGRQLTVPLVRETLDTLPTHK